MISILDRHKMTVEDLRRQLADMPPAINGGIGERDREATRASLRAWLFVKLNFEAMTAALWRDIAQSRTARSTLPRRREVPSIVPVTDDVPASVPVAARDELIRRRDFDVAVVRIVPFAALD